MKLELNKIYHGDALEVLKTFPNECVDMVMTSPPYWALRDYKVEGQLGLEENFNDYINKLCDIFDEVKRVLKKSGTCWVNIGDTYYTKSGSNFENDTIRKNQKATGINKANQLRGRGLLPSKCLVGIPERFVIEMTNRGWIRRNTIIWHKKNCMPSSSSDRFTVDFEYLYFFVKNKKYYFEQQFEPHLSKENRPPGVIRERTFKYNSKRNINPEAYNSPRARLNGENYDPQKSFYNPKSRNKRCVWTINTKPFKDVHFAVYPVELCETPIKAGCPGKVCKKCGKPKKTERVPINLYEGEEARLIKKDEPYSVQYRNGTIKIRKLPKKREIINYLRKWKGNKTYTQIAEFMNLPNTSVTHWFSDVYSTHGFSYPTKEQWIRLKEFLGFDDTYDEDMTKEYIKPAGVCETEYETRVISCDCNAGFEPGIVLDPFFGAGTTRVATLKLGRNSVGIELNKDYIKIANKRLKPYLEQKKLI